MHAAPSSEGQWAQEATRLRERVLKDIVYHGWPQGWVNSPPAFEDLGRIPSGPGYRMRKLRYEIVPGFHSTAILYEPENLQGKVPAVLNVNGHVGAPGKSVEYKQKRCINQARQGMLALNLEWLAMGELSHPENSHWFGAHLDLVGANGVGLFYLAMRRGLDYLAGHPNADPNRLAVTGLSGGGWQTILLSSLDTRVAVAVPVAGYSAMLSRLERTGDIGDVEQNPTDMLQIADYPHLTALRAPRPTLQIYNAEDDCCFRAPLVKPFIHDAIKPYYRLYGAEDRLAWHENTDPSNHNYQLDNRLQSYRFLAKQFGLPAVESEIPVGQEIKTAEELKVGLPAENLTILGVAKKLASEIRTPEASKQERLQTLRMVVRSKPFQVEHSWALANTKSKGVETRSYRLAFSGGLSATAVWAKAIATGEAAPATIVLRDNGKAKAQAEVADRVNSGEQVLALDLLFFGDSTPKERGFWTYTQLIATVGERPLGIEASQLLAAADWLKTAFGASRVRVETTGFRSQVVSLVAAALRPEVFSGVVNREGIQSLRYLLDKPVDYTAAPDLFCLDLLKEFDIESLRALADSRHATTANQMR